MGGELRVNGVRRIEQRARAGQIRHVGMVLVREHRVGRQAQLLRAFDLGVPIGTLDQAAHEANLVLARQSGNLVDKLQRTGLVGLHGQAETGPLRKLLRHLCCECLEHLERQLQPVDLFGIDCQVYVAPCGLFAQAPHARHQLGHHPFLVCVFIPRMQGAEFDGYAVVLLTRTSGLSALGDGPDRVLVAGQVLERIGTGACTFAQHVIAEPDISCLALCGGGFTHGLGNRLAEHKLAPQQLHCAQRGGNDGACAELGKDAAGGVAIGQEPLAHRNRGAGQACQGFFSGCVEVGAAQLVGSECDRGLGIGHPQQRFGQAHQGQTLGAGDRILFEQALHGPKRRRVLAHGLHPWRGHFCCTRPIQRIGQGAQALGDDLGFRAVRVGQAHKYFRG